MSSVELTVMTFLVIGLISTVARAVVSVASKRPATGLRAGVELWKHFTR